jgi:hypothetical protein
MVSLSIPNKLLSHDNAFHHVPMQVQGYPIIQGFIINPITGSLQLPPTPHSLARRRS